MNGMVIILYVYIHEIVIVYRFRKIYNINMNLFMLTRGNIT